MSEKFQNGSLTTYRVREGFQPRTPDQIKAIAQRHGMPESLVPDYAGDRTIVQRAIQSQVGSAKAQGWLVQLLDSDKTHVRYTIARIDKDVERERTDYTHDDVVRWSSEGGNGAHIEGTHEVAVAMDRAYQDLRGLIQAGDWTKKIVEYITGDCKGVAFLDSGKLYWIPPHGTQQLQALRAMLDDIGIGLMIGEIEAESHADVQEVAQGGINDQIDALRAEVEAFDGTQPASVYRNRLDKLRELRATALAYDAAIGIKLDEVRGVLSTIDAKVRGLLTVRLETTFHKDGTVERVERPPVAAQVAELHRLLALGEEALAQAIVDGRLVLDADDDDIARLLASDEDEVHAPDVALTQAVAAVPDLDPTLATLLTQPTETNDLPASW